MGDSARARGALFELLTRAPESDDAAAGVTLARAGLPPRLAAERVALARTLRLHGDPTAARVEVQRAVAQGDSSAATLVLYGELLVQANRLRDAELAYRASARDSALGPLAVYRRARVLVRLGDPGASDALSSFAVAYTADRDALTVAVALLTGEPQAAVTQRLREGPVLRSAAFPQSAIPSNRRTGSGSPHPPRRRTS